MLWGAAGAGIGAASVLLGQSNPFVLLILIVTCTIAGVLGRDWWLTQAVTKQDAENIAEFPVIAEMLALAVTAGEGPMAAMDPGHPAGDRPADHPARPDPGRDPLRHTFVAALTAARDRTRLEPLARFVDGMAVAIERGTPLADVLRAQAADVRALGKRRLLLEAGGRKEIAMMVPGKIHPWSLAAGRGSNGSPRRSRRQQDP